jgi:hypothetical protein
MGSVGVVLQAVGFFWDLSWHRDFGRESSFSPPHIVVLAGLFIGGVVAVWRVWRTPSAAYRHPLGGGRLLLAGVVCEILGLGWDDLWHRLFGLDLDAGLWSPPHLMVILGVWIQAAGCVTAALSDEPRARPGAAYLAAGALLASVAPIFGPIEYMPSHRDPFLYPILMAFVAAFVLFAGRAAVNQPSGCTIIAVLYSLVRGVPGLLLWLSGSMVSGYPTPLVVPAVLADWILNRPASSSRGTAILAGGVFGLLPFLEWPLVNWVASHQWPVYHWPIDVPLLALIPAALAGISGGLLGRLTGGWARRTFVSGDLA